MKRIKLCVALVGILVSLTGYYLDKANHFEWAMRLFVPQYKNALSAYEKTLADRSWVEKGQPGFAELSALLQPFLSGPGNLSISKFRVKATAFSVLSTDKGMESCPTITIEIVVSDGRSTSASGVRDMRPEIKAKYYDDKIFKKGHGIFLLGILLSVLALLPPFSREDAEQKAREATSDSAPGAEPEASQP